MATLSTTYTQLFDCYQSGQMSYAQLVEHMKDEVFERWVQKRIEKRAEQNRK